MSHSCGRSSVLVCVLGNVLVSAFMLLDRWGSTWHVLQLVRSNVLVIGLALCLVVCLQVCSCC
jgi:hypothetical protein